MADQRPEWLREASHDPTTVAQVYDTWASDYDTDLADWDYRAPQLTVERLTTTQAGATPVLDVGCGTGLVGRLLQEAGFTSVAGIDLSARSLELARQTGAYGELRQVDLQASAIPWDDDHFAALTCVGVMTYLPEVAGVVGEFCRAVEVGGSILFTQREDLWVDRQCQLVIDRLAGDGLCTVESISDPLPYLPGSEELGQIPARLVHLRSA